MPCCSSCKHDLNSDNFRGCNRCNKSFHWDCTKLNKFLIKQYKKNPYIVWWCQDCKDKYCIGCDKKFPNEQVDSIYCDRCSYWYHLSCSNLSIQDFDILSSRPSDKWTCDKCTNKFCKKCDRSTHNKPKSKCLSLIHI